MQTGMVPPFNLTPPSTASFTTDYWLKKEKTENITDRTAWHFNRPTSALAVRTKASAGGAITRQHMVKPNYSNVGPADYHGIVRKSDAMMHPAQRTHGLHSALDNGIDGHGGAYPTISILFPNAFFIHPMILMVASLYRHSLQTFRLILILVPAGGWA